MQKILLLFATGFGLGFSPVASGTTGSLPGLLLAAAISPLQWWWQAAIGVVLTAIAVPICQAAEDHYGSTDDRRIVADEYLTFPLCLIGIPWTSHLWLLPVAFVINRVLDIIKPPPARQSQALHGGLGIVMDDLITSLYSLGLMHLIWWAAQKFIG